MKRASPILAALALALTCALAASGCSDDSGPGPGGPTPRSYRMGFSSFPPSPDPALGFAALQLWTQRADGAIFHIEPPWGALIDGVPADSAVKVVHLPLAQYYRSKGLDIVITLDPGNGLNRGGENNELVALGRSLTEPAIQQIFRDYAIAIDTVLKPSMLGMASETNLIRLAAPPALYAAVRQVANDAAADVRAHDAAVQLYVSVQVDVAWNRTGAPMPGPPTYGGVAQDIADFPFAQAFALSSYPYLAGFAQPEDVPLDYFQRVANEVARPVLMDEGGWTSAAVGGIVSSPDKQARWIRRETTLLDNAGAIGWYQLTFTDIAISTFPPQPQGSTLALFISLGLVDTLLTPKPALSVWDTAFRRPRASQ